MKNKDFIKIDCCIFYKFTVKDGQLHEIACDKVLTEFEKYRIKQDKLYKSDFDNFLNEARVIENGSENNG